MYDIQLVIDQITVNTLTDSEPGDEDEVYFVVTGGTNINGETINNRVPAESGGQKGQGYDNFKEKETSPLVFELAQFSLNDGGRAGLVVGINDVDVDIGELIGTIGLGALGLGTVIVGAFAGSAELALGGTALLLDSARSLNDTLSERNGETIGTFAVGVFSKEGGLEVVWLPGVNAAPEPESEFRDDASYTTAFRSQGNGSDYSFRVSAKLLNTRISAISYSLVGEDGKNLLDQNSKRDLANLILIGSNAIDGTGNALDNILTGNEVKNTLIGLAGNDTLYGRGGDDVLIGGEGSDSMVGGAGDDTYEVDNIGDTISERENDGINDTVNASVSYLLGNNLENLNLTGSSAIDGAGNNFKNTITGNNADNILDGQAGDDLLVGNTGNDTLRGGQGEDTLNGGEGNDLIDGGDGFDTVTYENTVAAFKSPYGVIVNIDETRAYPALGQYGYTDPLAIEVIGIELILGDLIASGTAIDGLGNRDTLRNLENITASNLDDVLIGNSAVNFIQGLAGNDILIGNAGSDTLDGGDGIDIVSYKYDPGAISINLEQNAGTDGFGNVDQLLNIENVVGSISDDVIIGSSQENWLFGSIGKDTLQANGGNDKLIGGTEADRLDGGDGNDTASYLDAIAGITANLSRPQDNTGDAQGDTFISIEYLEGSQHSDRLLGDSQNNHIWGLDGDDYLDGLGGNDLLEGGLDNDTYRIDSLSTTIIEYFNQGIADTIDASINYTLDTNLENLNLLEGTAAINGIGNELGNSINGNSANNILNGGGGIDFLYGNFGSDTLVGGEGDDWLVGGKGADILTGGSGKDMFVYTDITDASDMIMDFTIGSDKIVMTDALKKLGYQGSNPIADGVLSTRQVNAGLTSLQFDPDGLGNAFRPAPFLLFKNVQASNFDINSFVV